LAFWAYTARNYGDPASLSDADDLRFEFAKPIADFAVLKASGRLLRTAPNRLRDLAELNFDRLNLLPLHPDQLAPSIRSAILPLPELPYSRSPRR